MTARSKAFRTAAKRCKVQIGKDWPFGGNEVVAIKDGRPVTAKEMFIVPTLHQQVVGNRTAGTLYIDTECQRFTSEAFADKRRIYVKNLETGER